MINKINLNNEMIKFIRENDITKKTPKEEIEKRLDVYLKYSGDYSLEAMPYLTVRNRYLKEIEEIINKGSNLYTYDEVWNGLECVCEQLKIIINTFAGVFGVDSSYCTPEYFIKQGNKNKNT